MSFFTVYIEGDKSFKWWSGGYTDGKIGIQYKINDNKRFLWLDIAKGITILLTIIGHSIGGGRILGIIHSFHMPLFFVLAGYTFKKTSDLAKMKEK